MTNPIRLGLFGSGARTEVLVDKAMIENKACVAACYDVNKDRSQYLSGKYNARRVFSEEELLSSNDVDAFIISLAPKYHTAAAMAAIETGKPIYLEKPIATNLLDAKKLLEKVEATGVSCYVGLMHRYIPVFRRITQMIREGQIGDLLAVNNQWLAWPNELMFQGSGNWRGDPETGGQLVYHYCHYFDLLGQWGGEFKSVTASMNKLVGKSPGPDTIFATLEYESGALAQCHFSEVSYKRGHFGWVHGSEATLEYEWTDPSYIKIYRSKTGPRTADEIIDDIPSVMPDSERMEHFIQVACGEASPEVTVYDAYKTNLIAHAITYSVQAGQKIILNQI